MRIIRNGSACALLVAAHAATLAQTTPAPMQQVMIKADADTLRTQATTTAIVIRHDDIVRHGDTSLADVLKRQPGITLGGSPGAPPTIRMRGLGGDYVAILLDGVPAPAGFSLESLEPGLIERIEIGRVVTAETSSQAVAGSINVILRRASAGTNEIKAGSALIAGYAAPQLLAQHSARLGPLAYSLSATLRRNRNPIEAVTREEGMHPTLLRATDWVEHQVEDVLELAPRLTWQPNGRDSITSQSYLRRRRIDNAKREVESTMLGNPTAYPRSDQAYRTDPLHGYADLAWNRKLDAGARLALKLSSFYTTRDADFAYRGRSLDGTLLRTNAVASGPTEREWTGSGSWRRPLWGSHTLAAGWEIGRKTRTEYRRERQVDGNGAQLLTSDEDYRAQVTRSAFFIQDEWDITPAWSAYAGLRREEVRTTGEGNAAAPVDVDAGAWSPVFQTLYRRARPDGDTGSRDGFRLAVSRTYKAPNIVQLMPRRYTVDNNNSATNPDQQGNPGLRPELALGVDLAWERTFGKNGMTSVSAFHKRIRDITLIDIRQNLGVWTATPVNAGMATVRGIEFEGKATIGRLAARVNLARNWSRVDNVPGPDNRIAGQPGYNGNLGLDYSTASGRIDVGGSYTHTSRVLSRSSASIVDADSMKRQLDLYALWKRDARSRLRLSVSDLLQQDVRERRTFEGNALLIRATTYRVRATWRLVWEHSL
jgi:outer membrane receptor protein involved in Fe transport